MHYRAITSSAEETRRFGERLAQDLSSGDVVALVGPLGSGKTCLAQGICCGLEVTDYVTSPSFTIVNEYRGRLPVYHFDLFRVHDPAELFELGYEEYFYGNGVCIIEWAEKIRDFLPEGRVGVTLKRLGELKREIEVKSEVQETVS